MHSVIYPEEPNNINKLFCTQHLVFKVSVITVILCIAEPARIYIYLRNTHAHIHVL